jgi:glucosamine-phosphate N-acetyltransferase
MLKESDLNHGFIECLETLGKAQTKLSDMVHIFKQRKKHGIKTFVVEEKDSSNIIASGSIIFEPKFRYTEKCAHLEDVCVRPEYQKKGIGKKLVLYLIQYAKKKKCYKIILNSHENNTPFYTKLGFQKHENGLRLDLI